MSYDDFKAARPWSIEDYRLRLATYIPAYWLAKPINFAPTLCARLGWFCVQEDVLRCFTCSCRISVSKFVITHQSRGETEQIPQLLVSGHDKACTWRKYYCDEDIVEALYGSNEQKRRRSSFNRIPERLLPVLTENLENSKKDILAKNGWEYQGNGIIFCNVCQRTVACWIFGGEDPLHEAREQVESANRKRARSPINDIHRYPVEEESRPLKRSRKMKPTEGIFSVGQNVKSVLILSGGHIAMEVIAEGENEDEKEDTPQSQSMEERRAEKIRKNKTKLDLLTIDKSRTFNPVNEHRIMCDWRKRLMHSDS